MFQAIKLTFNHKTILNLYIADEINLWQHNLHGKFASLNYLNYLMLLS